MILNPQTSELADYLLLLASNLETAIHEYLHTLATIEKQLLVLEGATCTGKPHWRDINTQGKAAKLCIIHSIDGICDLHGTPDAGKRIRTYIGSNPGKITAALAAITSETKRRELQADTWAIETNLHNVSRYLRICYRHLDHTAPGPATNEPPGPTKQPQW